jgi:hypothetical protein
MAKRSRKRRTADRPAPATPAAAPTAETAPDAPADAPEVSKSERRNAEVRANLVPLADGERPGAVTVGAIVALVLALGNLVLVAIDFKVDGRSPGPGGGILFGVILLAAAWGMWTVRYWAVLGFEALLAIIVISGALSLLVASDWRGAAISLAVIGFGGWLFWKLVRAMARIQMPRLER